MHYATLTVNRISRPSAAILATSMRFSLRSLLTFLTAFAVVFGAAVYLTKDYREREALRGELLSTGATFVSVSPSRSIRVLFAAPITMATIGKYKEFESIELQRVEIDADSIDALAELEMVDVLHFQSCTFHDSPDLTPLSQMGSVRSLLFWNTPIDDEATPAIAEVPGLKVVSLSATKVTPAGIDQLRSARPEIRIDYRP